MSHHLITGGAGFIGSALAHRLVKAGHTVMILDRFSRGKMDRVPEEARILQGDIRDPNTVGFIAWTGADVIWHLAYVQGTQTFYAEPKEVIDVALRGITNILGVCENLEAPPDFFLVSSSEVYQNPPPGMYPTDETVPLTVPDVTNSRYSYGGGKIAQELATMAYSNAGILNRGVIVRPHNIYGPDMGQDHVVPQFALRMLEMASGTPPLPFGIQGTGAETRSFCYIDDCVDGLMVLLDKGEDRNVYHLGNPAEEYRISDLAHMVADYYGRNIKVVPGKLLEGSPPRRKPDISKLGALGFEPAVSLSEGLVPTLEWYRPIGLVAA